MNVSVSGVHVKTVYVSSGKTVNVKPNVKTGHVLTVGVTRKPKNYYSKYC